jgi:dipeptidyl aminopeptidase/acylaminoacyl peptidase
VILTKEPDRALLPRDTSPNLRRLIDRCLEKDPKRRLRDIGEARILLEQPAETPGHVAQERRRLTWVPWAIAAVALLIAGAAVWAWLRAPKPATRPVFHLVAPLQLARFALLAISRDGHKLAFPSGQFNQLHVRLSDQMDSRPLPGTEDSGSAAFSPDGQWLAFGQGPSPPQRKLKKVQVSGGAAITLCDVSPYGIDWGRDGNIIFGSGSGLFRVSAAGGKPEPLTAVDFKKGEFSHQSPRILPGGDAVLFTIVSQPTETKIAVLSLKTRAQRVLVGAGAGPNYVPAASGAAGNLVFWRAGSLFAIPFDPRRLEVSGSPIPVLEGVAGASGRVYAGSAGYSVSDSGVLVYLPGNATPFANSTLVWVDRQGKELPVPHGAPPPGSYRAARLSPDGKLVAVTVGDRSQNRNHIAVYDTTRGTLTRLTFQGHADYPTWSPDGKRLAFVLTDSGKNFISWVPADGTRPPETVAALDKIAVLSSWSPDGKILAFHQLELPTDIWLLPFTPVKAAPGRYQETPYEKFGGEFSPDGRWFAYAATSDRNAGTSASSSQVFVQPAPAGATGSPAGKWQVSVDGGTGPRWSKDSRELFFRSGDKVMSVAIEPGPTFRAGTPRLLFEGRYAMSFPSGTGYDVSPDGKRFIMIKSLESEGPSAQIHYVLDWFDDVRRRVRAGAEGQ